MNYYNKYLKYRNKYLDLKNSFLQGGQTKEERIREIEKCYLEESIPFVLHCNKRGFKQHEGECWNDTIQTLMCFTDGIKETIQRKLLNLTAEEIIELAFLKGRDKFLPNFYKMNLLKIENLKIRLIKYIKLLQNRLCNYIDITNLDEKTCLHIQKNCIEYNNSCPSKNPDLVVLYDSKFPVRSETAILGIESAITGLKIFDRIKDESKLLNFHAGNSANSRLLYLLLSVIFLDEQYFLTSINHFTNTYSIKDVDESLCIDIKLETNKGETHTTGFLKCDNILYYYDDNNENMIEFDWKKYLKFYLLNGEIFKPILYLYKSKAPFFYNNRNKKYYYFNTDINNVELISEEILITDIFTVLTFTFIKKNIITNIKDYININSDTLILIELFHEQYDNIINYLDDGLDPNIIFSTNMIIKKYDMLYKIAYVNKLTIEITELVIRNLISNSVNIELYINDRFRLEKDSFDNYNIFDLLLKYDNVNVFKYLFEVYKIKYTDTNNIGYNLVFRSVYFNANKIFDFFITKIEPTIILSMRSNINNIDNINYGYTLLHIAVQQNNIYIINKLTELAKTHKKNIFIVKTLNPVSNQKIPAELADNRKNKLYIDMKYAEYKIHIASNEKEKSRAQAEKAEINKEYKKL